VSVDKFAVLKKYFGYEVFREGQEQLIDSILSGRDCMGIMPTGAGKSICFQVPAMCMDGVTIVISPLISLMKDQVNSLTQSGINTAFINSSLNEKQISRVYENIKQGIYKIIYIAPERLEDGVFNDFIANIEVSMVTVDEAHCISQWGQDFRPSYVKIIDFIENLPKRPIISAFTATATPAVREDISILLKLKNPDILITGFNRQNLYFEVQKPKDKFVALLTFLSSRRDKFGIVYCSTRATVEDVCERLNNSGYNASRYHAGLGDNERRENQEDFLFDRVQIMAATNAFGMGIDKSNVGFVVHYNMPKNIESYYQEAGRAGRDGENADCLLLYSGSDVRTNMYIIEHNNDAVYADLKTELMLKERDRQRLKEMTFYCHTNDCLRAYILKYFAEKPENFCGNCGNCNKNYENTDITVESQKILSCVVRLKGNYGIKMVIDVLRGSKNERIVNLKFNELSTYNISCLSEKQLREIINHLVLYEYLTISNDGYFVLKLGEKYKEILYNNQKIEMKLIKTIEKEKEIKIAKEEKVQKVNQKLFDELKKIRLEIANEQNVPAFVVLADSSLTGMCLKLPKNNEELLKVSGIGQVKLERYGKYFLKIINDFLENEHPGNTINTIVEELPNKVAYNDIEISDEAATISTIADRINCILMQNSEKKLSGMKINEWLVSEKYLFFDENEKGEIIKKPTEKGIEIGIISLKRFIRGEEKDVNYYNKTAQKMIVDCLDEIIEFKVKK